MKDRIESILGALGTKPERYANGEIFASCPLPGHLDRNPSFSIRESDGVWFCFACNEGGSLVRLVSKVLNLDREEAKRWVFEFIDDELTYKIENILSKNTVKTKRIHDPVNEISNKSIESIPLCPLDKLQKWNIKSESVVERFGIRYDENRIRTSLKHGYYIGPAIVIPHVFLGKLVGIQERWLDENRPKWIPKYTNTVDFPKSETLFGWDYAIEFYDKTIFVVESALSAIRLWSVGYPSVATFGASVSIRQIGMLNSFQSVCLLFDNDEAGRKSTTELIDKLYNDVYVLSQNFDQEKSDIADVDDNVIHEMLDNRVPAFGYYLDNVISKL